MQEKALKEIIGLMTVLDESEKTLLNQSLGKELDYDSIANDLDSLCKDVSLYIKKNEKLVAETKHLSSLLETLMYCASSLNALATGLANKSNNRAKYGMFQYRKDLKDYENLKGLYSQAALMFQNYHR